MNDQTQQIYMSIFEPQLKKVEPLTKKDIKGLAGTTWLERTPSTNMKMVIFMEKIYQGKLDKNGNVDNIKGIDSWELKIKFISLPEELNNFIAEYVYDYTSTNIPIFFKRKSFKFKKSLI